MKKANNYTDAVKNEVYNDIETMTAEPGRKTYTNEEAEAFLSDLKTAGRKGVKLPRINMAFSPLLFDYIKTMARVSGQTQTELVNSIIYKHYEENKALYETALQFRDNL